ncbi:alanyl-tRNA editing protein [Brevibacillus sp. SYP-B805]|uniref:alanyl-tRNA editing protein n=1 Tax=Brevibacillus sp. SYP-B805 TaxID=1578199 RepID=UPI0013EB492C|nr:DHHA1 domain-containing protein [Brevibacillus sp. SYP-B805]NGQ96241.1 alanyl-tRNA editing protein [Brevibacillus sp. SYP-B805]
MKDRLYYTDPYIQTFEANVIYQGSEEDGTPYIVLDRTAFYPTGGGQPCDTGTLNGIEVIQVEEVDSTVRHRLSRPFPPGTTTAAGSIDWQRRFDHMQQHAGQHILSAAFAELFDAQTVGFHLGRERVTIDLAVEEVTEEMAVQAVELANRIVFENRPIIARFVDPVELARLPLRKPPAVTENIRIVTIEGFDYNPCGGTHPKQTGEIGPIQILDWERMKGNVRVAFICGGRTARELWHKHRVLKQLGRLLSSSEAELPDAVARLQLERKETERALQEANQKLLEAEARERMREAETIGGLRLAAVALAERPLPDMQKLAQRMVALDPTAIALLVSSGPKTQLVFARGEAVSLPMNELLREALPLIDGKGGGNPAMAQGGGTGGPSPEDLLTQIKESLLTRITP